MHYDRTLNRSLLARCHRCEWWYQADDSEFPSEFIFDLAYQICDGDVVLREIEPHGVVSRDSGGNPLFVHQFTDKERPRIWQWFHARLRMQQDHLLEKMSAAIQQDFQSRTEAAEATFLELACEHAR